MKVGDRVVCVRAHLNPKCGLKKGAIYSIVNIKLCSCGGASFDVGIAGSCNHGKCFKCKKRYSKQPTIWWISSRSFAPISYNSAHDELINKAITEEKADIKVTETEKV